MPQDSKPVKARINRRSDERDSVTRCWQTETPFDANGTCRGDWHTAVWGESMGRLPAEMREMLRDDMARHGRLFIVYSYATPIAWRNGDYTCRPATKYSVTTSKHQGRIY